MAAPRTVVDASVVVKWFLPEPSEQAAQRLLRHYQEESVRLLAPALIILEVSNVFCKRVRRGEMSATWAKESYRLLNVNAPILIDNRYLMDEAISLALASGQALYDCLYLALSLRQGCDMITADGKFHAAVAKTFPNVLPL